MQTPQYLQGYEKLNPFDNMNSSNDVRNSKNLRESAEDEDCTSESFKQYQKECDEIMYEKSTYNPYDIQLTTELNSSNNGKRGYLLSLIFL